MTMFLTIVAFLIIFSLLILIHELGHFYVARKAGVKVLEFGMGLPPRLWGYQKKKSGTLYSINAIPFGGFVRLYGEDFTDSKAQKSKDSFSGKANWKKLLIVIAGVVMNFLLAWLLLTIGFTFGIQPLLLNDKDVIQAIDQGVVQIEEGVRVNKVNDQTLNNQLKSGDRILRINNKVVGLGFGFEDLKKVENVRFVARGVEGVKRFEMKWDPQKLPFEVDQIIYLPKVVIFNVSDQSRFKKLGLAKGDVVMKVDGHSIIGAGGFEDAVKSGQDHYFNLVSQDKLYSEDISYNGLQGIVITDVIADSPASDSGLLSGDLVAQINGVKIKTIQDAVFALKLNKTEMTFTLNRNGNLTNIYVEPDQNGLAGIYMTELKEIDGVTYYEKSVPSSLLKINDVKYPVHVAALKSLEEMGRLSVLTVQMFGDLMATIFTKFTVPEGVAGPVGIAQLTYTFVQEGLLSLIRFAALLSLSLAIINILPVPGLDGGRLILILFAMITRKKINQKVEAWLHLFGFLFLIALLFLVTFNDLVKLFS
jgi:regulator of sigma E protease